MTIKAINNVPTETLTYVYRNWYGKIYNDLDYEKKLREDFDAIYKRVKRIMKQDWAQRVAEQNMGICSDREIMALDLTYQALKSIKL